MPYQKANAPVRAHFGLTQQQLARYLGVPTATLAHYEAGRRDLALAPFLRLVPLAQLLPPPEGYGLPAAPPEAAPPEADLLEAGPLRARWRTCRLQALALARRLHTGQAQAAALHRRRLGLARLHTAAPADPAEAVIYARWLAELAEDLTLADPAPTPTALALLMVRHQAVLTEMAALEKALATAV